MSALISVGLLKIIIILFPCSYLVGVAVRPLKQTSITNIIKSFVTGFVVSQALFFVLCVPMALAKLNIRILVLSYAAVMGLLCVWGLVSVVRQLIAAFDLHAIASAISPSRLKAWAKNSESWLMMAYILIFCLLLGYQCVHSAKQWARNYTYDDYTYVTESSNILNTGQLGFKNINTGAEYESFDVKRDLNSWTTYIAVLGYVSEKNVAVIAHTFLAVFLLFVAYAVYYYVGSILFEKATERMIFLIMVASTYIWGFYTMYSLTYRLNILLWQGKAVVSVIYMPLLIGFLIELDKRTKKLSDVFYLVCITAAACACSMMGCAFSLITLSIMFVIYSVYHRRIWNLGYMIAAVAIPIAQLSTYVWFGKLVDLWQ